MFVGPATAQWWEPDLQVSALAAVRAVVPDVVRARREGGEGRLRYGDGSDYGESVLFSPAEAAVELDAAANPWLSVFFHGQYQPEDKHGVGIAAAFLEVTPPLPTAVAIRLKGGAFFPEVSRENRDVAWSNSYTLTNSPAKTWIAEEVRPIGVAATLSHAAEEISGSLEGGFFFANDSSGAALALGGWALNDVKTAVTGGEVRTFNPLANEPSAYGQPAAFQPFRELDDRPGFHFLAQLDVYRFGGASLLYWDNCGDVDVNSLMVWQTRFFAADIELALPWEVTLLPSAMVGETRNAQLGTDFWTTSALLARDFDRLRVGLRYDHFEQDDDSRDLTELSLEEDGDAVTAAVSYSLGAHHRFAGELAYVDACRDSVASGCKRETMLQVEYRLMF